MQGRSTVTNLIEYASFVLKAMEEGFQVDSTYTDFSKAFDKVRHCLLLLKFAASPIEPARCDLLRSHLSARIQRIRIGNCVSSEIWVTSGVPQGSHLGPLCFIWFVNDICRIFSYIRVLFYADDKKLFLPVSSSQDCLKIQSDLDCLAQWCSGNALPLNVSKCKIMSFTRSFNPTRFAYTIGSSTLERVDFITDLGVVLDRKMTFKITYRHIRHIDVTIAKGFAMLRFVKRLSKEFQDPYTFKSLYMSCCCVWQPFYAVHNAKIERIQKKFVKYALRRLRWDTNLDLPPCTSCCMLLSLETLETRRDIARHIFRKSFITSFIG
jgi:Reverse transcriptase (RNA-dependent DNA polymerase)